MKLLLVPFVLLLTGCTYRVETGPNGELVAAARSGDATTILRLATTGLDLEFRSGVNNWTPLQHAVHKNQHAGIRALLEAHANPDSALHMASSYGYSDVAQMLLQAGADPARVEKEGNALDYALFGAVDIDRWTEGHCQTETVRVILQHAPTLRPARRHPAGKCAAIDVLLAQKRG